MSLNRVVALLTPLFATAAGGVATWIAENFPGVEVSQGALEEIFIAGALVALAPAAQWLHGWQKHEAQQAEAQKEVALASAAPPELLAIEPIGEETVFDETGGFDELEVFDEVAELDELDEALLADDEEPAPAGG
jgi:hypothetical protein